MEQLKPKELQEIEMDIKNLAVKKCWKINRSGTKVKICRKAENAYDTYLNGNYISTDTECTIAFELMKVLLNKL
jgi:hypothetical protein